MNNRALLGGLVAAIALLVITSPLSGVFQRAEPSALPAQVSPLPINAGSSLGSGLIALWHLDGSGSDSAGGNNAASGGNTTYSGNAASFDGAGDYLNAGAVSSLGGAGNFTVAAWVKPRLDNISGSPDAIVTKCGGGGIPNKNFVLQWSNDEVYDFRVYNSAGSALARANTYLRDTNWHHVAGVYNGSQVSLYLDGVLQQSSSLSGGLNSNGTPVYLGGDYGCGVGSWDGLLDEVAIWNRALGASEIQMLVSGSGNSNPNPPAVPVDSTVSPDFSNVPTTPFDITPPSVQITSPANGITVGGAGVIQAGASDNVGVVGVQFKLDGQDLGPEDRSRPFTRNWDTAKSANGPHTITAVARDAAGNSTVSAPSVVTVLNLDAGSVPVQPTNPANPNLPNLPPPDTTPPSVSVVAPAAGSTVSGSNVPFRAVASDNVAVAGVQFRINGVNVGGPDTSYPYEVIWNTIGSVNGATHVLSAVATDSSGNTTASANVSVVVNNVVAPVCGNGVIESGEQCDGGNLGGNTCPAGTTGAVSCTATCQLNTTQCTSTNPNPPSGSWTPPIGIPDPRASNQANFDFLQPGPANPSPWTSTAGGYKFYYIQRGGTPSCSDSNNTYGTPSAPRCTIPSTIPAGSVVNINGTYNTGGNININPQGTASAPVFVRSFNPANPARIQAKVRIGESSAASYGIFDNLIIESGGGQVGKIGIHGSNNHHLVIRNSDVSGSLTEGGVVVTGSYNVIYNNVVHDSGYSADGQDNGGIFVGNYPSHHIWILDNTCYRNGQACGLVNPGYYTDDTNNDGVAMNSSGDVSNAEANSYINHVYIGRNTAYNGQQSLFWTKHGDYIIFSENVGHDAVDLDNQDPPNCAGQQYAPSNVWWIANTFYNCKAGIIVQGDSFVAVDPTNNVNMIGNLIYDVPTAQYWEGGIVINGSIKRSIINNTTASVRKNDNGGVYVEANNIGFSDPTQFVNAAAKNFRLKSTSTHVDTGNNAALDTVDTTYFNAIGVHIKKDLDGITRPHGSTVDKGAYEYH